MRNTTFMSDDDLIRKAIRVLMDKLGPVETIRFLGVRRRRRLDAVARHRKWQRSLNEKRFLEEIFGCR